jgi:hypothetical protein
MYYFDSMILVIDVKIGKVGDGERKYLDNEGDEGSYYNNNINTINGFEVPHHHLHKSDPYSSITPCWYNKSVHQQRACDDDDDDDDDSGCHASARQSLQ